MRMDKLMKGLQEAFAAAQSEKDRITLGKLATRLAVAEAALTKARLSARVRLDIEGPKWNTERWKAKLRAEAEVEKKAELANWKAELVQRQAELDAREKKLAKRQRAEAGAITYPHSGSDVDGE